MKGIKIIKIKSELGAGTRGASMGCDALRMAGLDAKSPFFGNYESIEIQDENQRLMEPSPYAHAKFIDDILTVETRICETICTTLQDDLFPLIISGDHSSAYGVMAGIKKHDPLQRLGVIWIDAHADLHSPYTTPSGNVHGMPLAMACQIDNRKCRINPVSDAELTYWERLKQIGTPSPKLLPEDLVYIVPRSVEKQEQYLIDKYKIRVITMDEIQRASLKTCVQRALNTLRHCDTLFISFDVDSINPDFSKGTGTLVRGGLTFEEAMRLNEELVKAGKPCAWEVTEINPLLDTENKMARGVFPLLEKVAIAMEK